MITVTFSPESEQQVAALAQAMMAYFRATVTTTDAPPVEDEAPKAPRRAKKAEVPVVEAPAVEAPAAPTLVEVRAKLIALKEAGKGAQAKELLTSRGFANLTVVPQDRYAEILTAAETL
jgi:hypothetical protein